ncbi:cell division protein FtsQ/DivIB [Advenella sp. WQ 585]|uniref:Cell division protein FtsQ n=1 Tax=Advenella mandrilli TaxID=2800330 RepID=A0ABS1EDK3_9BURK|nr:cell division protein FtsQ/DivIB [Advenella mandrilli]MBK1781987.1 cell division protein FtsQ/DivIB [Advenella mandrilli]
MLNNARVTNLIANVIAIMAVIILIAGGIYWLAHRPMFNLSRITIEPVKGRVLNYVSPASIQATIAGKLKGNFFTINLDETKRVFETSPWVRQAHLRRVWPDGLLLKIEEHEPFAFWNENQMINTWGELFSANQAELNSESELPQFNGPDGSELLVVQRYAELVRWLAPLKFGVNEITLSDRYAWRVELSNDMELVMGRDPGADAINPHGGQGAVSFSSTIERFVRSWPILQNRIEGRKINKVDLRYTKGFAITYAPVDNTLPVDSKEKK